MSNRGPFIFLDSGAYSAFTKKVEIKIDEYIEFIKKNSEYVRWYSNLDVIGDPDESIKNQKYMESKGLKPLPCYHYGEPPEYLLNYLSKGYDYICIGGMVPVPTVSLITWLDLLWNTYLVDKNGMPKVKVHGFGMTSLEIIFRYPWYSVDSTSWVLTSRFGSVFVPVRVKRGKYSYKETALKVCVSSKSPSKRDEGKHILTFSPMERDLILEYFDYKGFKLGKSKYGKDGTEVIIEQGLSNDYKQRDELNIIYFLDLEKSLPKWPWPLNPSDRAKRGFDI